MTPDMVNVAVFAGLFAGVAFFAGWSFGWKSCSKFWREEFRRFHR